MLEDVWPYLNRVAFNWWWVVPGGVLGIDSRFKLWFPHYKSWREKQPWFMNARPRYILLFCFIVANFLAFHEARTETRKAQADLASYRVQRHIDTVPGLRKQLDNFVSKHKSKQITVFQYGHYDEALMLEHEISAYLQWGKGANVRVAPCMDVPIKGIKFDDSDENNPKITVGLQE